MCTAHYRWIYVPKRHESVIVIDRAVSPSLTVGLILSAECYPSSAFLGKQARNLSSGVMLDWQRDSEEAL